MNSQTLLTSLKVQDQNLDMLIETLEAQRQAIIKNDYAALENTINIEQKILLNVEREETARLNVIKEIANAYSLNLKSNSVDDLIKSGHQHLGGNLNELIKVRIALKEKLQQITQINTQMKDVIEFSRNMIKETILMIAGPNKHALVNKRV